MQQSEEGLEPRNILGFMGSNRNGVRNRMSAAFSDPILPDALPFKGKDY